jgi:NAD+ kinase
MGKRIWLRFKGDLPSAVDFASRMKSHLASRGFLFVDEPNDAMTHAILLGGDGTLLAGIRELGDHRFRVPLVCVHASTGLGFLYPMTSPGLKNADESLWLNHFANLLEQDHYQIEERWGLEAHVDGDRQLLWAANDFVISKGTLSRMVLLRVRLDGRELVPRMRGDGLIVASSAGSTAYSLSAGGPVVQPNLKNMVLTPISPHDLTQRPVVLGGDAVATIEVLDPKIPCFLTNDGQSKMDLSAFSKVEVRRSAKPLKVVVPKNPELHLQDFVDAVRTKLGLGGRHS